MQTYIDGYVVKTFIKHILNLLPFTITRNQRYDRLTAAIIKKYIRPGDNCIDVGTHKGEILDLLLKQSPSGQHFGFEPIPVLFRALQKKYASVPNCRLFQLAIADRSATASFNHVITNPAYSGLEKRRYDRKNEKDETIAVQTERLDALIPETLPVRFIKIDVEGGELGVLRGAQQLIARTQPLIIFESGLGASEFYGTQPAAVFNFFEGLDYQVSLLDKFLDGGSHLSLAGFENEFLNNTNYYFVAHPAVQ